MNEHVGSCEWVRKCSKCDSAFLTNGPVLVDGVQYVPGYCKLCASVVCEVCCPHKAARLRVLESITEDKT